MGIERQPKSSRVELGCRGPLLIHPSGLGKNEENCPVLRSTVQTEVRLVFHTCADFLSELKQKDCLHRSNVSKPLSRLAGEATLFSGHFFNNSFIHSWVVDTEGQSFNEARFY